MIGVLKAYLDESGIHQGSRICAIAGFVGQQEEWDRIERLWSSALANEGINSFHMAEFESRLGPYQNWSGTRRQTFLASLVRIVKSREIFNIGSGIVTEDFFRLDIDDRRWMTHGNPEIPYFLCFQHCIVETAHQADGLDDSEKVEFIFDRQVDFAAEATRPYNRMKSDEAWGNRFRMGDAVAFESRQDTAALQAADFAAYESYKQLEDKLYNPERPVRLPIRQFRARPFRGRYFTRESLQDLIRARL